MKIENIRILQVDLPLPKPLVTAIHKTTSVGCVLVAIETDTGVVGENYIFSLNQQRLPAFAAIIESLKPYLIGKNPMMVEQIWQQMWADLNPIGQKGMAVSAVSALDTALWDIIGKQAELPLYQLFGGCRDRVRTYASSGLWLSDSIDQLIAEAEQFIAQGFQAMKLRVGSADIKQDVQRAAALRAAVGDDIDILTDANQSLSPRQAMTLARQLEPYDIYWLEEPVAADDLNGQQRVMHSSNIQIASGETDYGCAGMKTILDARCTDVLMPDLQRIGGLSEFRRAAALAASYHMPISTHIFTEQSLAIAGSAANCISVEHVDWFAALYNETVEIEQGDIVLPQRPGIGFSFNYQCIAEYQL